jgi:hypothetical protein
MLRNLLLASGIVLGLTFFTAGGRSATPATSNHGVPKVADDGAAGDGPTAADQPDDRGSEPAAGTRAADRPDDRASEPGSDADESGGCRSSGGERTHKVILLLALLLAVCIRNRHR